MPGAGESGGGGGTGGGLTPAQAQQITDILADTGTTLPAQINQILAILGIPAGADLSTDIAAIAAAITAGFVAGAKEATLTAGLALLARLTDVDTTAMLAGTGNMGNNQNMAFLVRGIADGMINALTLITALQINPTLIDTVTGLNLAWQGAWQRIGATHVAIANAGWYKVEVVLTSTGAAWGGGQRLICLRDLTGVVIDYALESININTPVMPANPGTIRWTLNRTFYFPAGAQISAFVYGLGPDANVNATYSVYRAV